MGIKVNFTRAVGPVMATFVAPLLRVMPTFLCQKRHEGWDSFIFIGHACSLFKILRLLHKKLLFLTNYILSNSFMITQKHFDASNFYVGNNSSLFFAILHLTSFFEIKKIKRKVIDKIICNFKEKRNFNFERIEKKLKERNVQYLPNFILIQK